MNFKTFPVASTTIFPISNSTAGGQLITEWNLRCRDMVSSYSEIEYDVASSYTHSEDDFSVRVYQDDSGTIISNSTLEIMPGTAIINGHYVKEEARMIVDLLEGNKELASLGMETLSGKLAIGIKAFYSTESSMVGAMEPENDEDVYVGVQLIVLPESKLKTPEDCPDDQDSVTCHIKLASFTFLDNEIRGVNNYTGKIKYIDAERIDNIDKIISGNYVSRDGIQPKKLYVLAGKQINGIVNDTWCDATDSLFVWDKNPVRTTEEPEYDSAQFITKSTGETTLYLPHKNVDGMKVTLDEKSEDYGKNEYYESVELDLPLADFSTNTSGTVSSDYTKRIKAISNKLDNYFELIKGKQVAYLDSLAAGMNKQVKEGGSLPDINNNWDPGDYTLVNLDNHALASETTTNYTRPPSTLYAILPGTVKAIKFYGTGIKNSSEIPDALQGVRIGGIVEQSTAPITAKDTESANFDVQGYLSNSDIVPGTLTYTTPEGIVFKDNGENELIYSEDDNTNDSGDPKVLEADIDTYDGDSTQLFTVSEQTVDGVTGYAIECNGAYLTVTETTPYKMYFSSELTIYGLFIFLDSDNKVQQSGLDSITTADGSRSIRPVEIMSKALVLVEAVNNSELLSGVNELITEVDKLTDKDSTESVPYIKKLVDAVLEALSTEDASSASTYAEELKTSVDKVFDDDKYKDLRDQVDKTKTAVDTAVSSEEGQESIKAKTEAVEKAYEELNTFVTKLDSQMDSLTLLVNNVKRQETLLEGKKVENETVKNNKLSNIPIKPYSVTLTVGSKKYTDDGDKGFLDSSGKSVSNATINYTTGEITGFSGTIKASYTYSFNYDIYGRVTGYDNGTISYVYVSENLDMQEQLWQVMETGSSASIFNSYYGQALTEQDAKKLKGTTYTIDYMDGAIGGLPSIGTASYSYYSSDILEDLLNYFTVTDETRGVAFHTEYEYRYITGEEVASGGQTVHYPLKPDSVRVTNTSGTVYTDDSNGGFIDSEGVTLSGAKVNYTNGTISGIKIDTVDYAYQYDKYIQYEDYFVYRYRIDDNNYQDYYYVVSEEGSRIWSDPIWLTGQIALATTSSVGGFLNVSDSDLDNGYIILNDDGHLQLLDYDLLRSGAAAYQLGENITVSSGLASDEIQEYLDEYINQRVAFPNSNQISNAASSTSGTVYSDPSVIHLTVDLSAEDDPYTITIDDIDSRFGSSIYLHITGSANSNTTLILSDIQKLRIDNSMEYDESDPPIIKIYRCGLYYDASTLNTIAYCNRNQDTTGMQDISFWYHRYESTDADLVVNDMTVSEINAPIISDPIDFWNATSPNDNHFHVALHDITFAHDGTIVGCGLLIANDTTSNIEEGHHVSAGTFTLPQGDGLQYPERLMTHALKVSGTFESGYSSTDGYYVLQDTIFTALTQTYASSTTYTVSSGDTLSKIASKFNTTVDVIKSLNSGIKSDTNLYEGLTLTVNLGSMTAASGSILFHTNVNLMTVDFGGISTEAWEPDTYHIFHGGALS